MFQQQEVDLLVVRSQVSTTLALLSAYEHNPTPSLSTMEADLSASGTLQALAITVRTIPKPCPGEVNVHKGPEGTPREQTPSTDFWMHFAYYTLPNETKTVYKDCSI